MSNITYNPPNFRNIREEDFRTELDKFAQYIALIAKTTDATTVQSPATGAGYKWIHGQVSVTGSKIGMPTGLATVSNCGASLQGKTASNLTATCVKSSSVTGGIDLYVWMPTSSADTTPVAATSAVTIAWWAAGS